LCLFGLSGGEEEEVVHAKAPRREEEEGLGSRRDAESAEIVSIGVKRRKKLVSAARGCGTE
jgi:hypothetical protein